MSHPIIERCVLKNGLRIIHARSSESRAFSISIHIQAGSRDETTKNNGIFHFLEHMMFRGTARHPNSVALAHALETLGGENNGYTDYESSAFWIKGNASKIADGFAVFADLLFSPTFPDIEIERQILLQELAGDYNDSGHIICPTSLGMKALFQNHPLGMPVVGTRENLLNIQVADLSKQRESFYQPQNSILVVSSPCDLNKNFSHIEKLFGHPWNSHLVEHSRHAPKLAHGTAVATENHSDSQLDIKLLFPAYGGASPHVVAQTFFQRILDDGIASRLPSNVRERAGLAYDVSCDVSAFSDIGACSIDASVSEDGLTPFLAILKSELARATNSTPSPEEMERVRNRYTFALETLREDTSAYLDYLVWHSFLQSELTPEKELALVEALTPHDIQNVARHIVGAPRRAAALVGPNARARNHELGQFLTTLGATVAPKEGFC
jgi:predicted Zn-dependent peptidase